MKCNHCGNGHKYADCWQREENAGKRPATYKVPFEQAQANMDRAGNKIEYLLAGISFPQDHKILSDSNVWIADTAATVHTTPHNLGMCDAESATANDAITVGNGNKEPASKIANIIGMICDKEGHELHRTKLHEVTHLPSGKFNLFSLTRMQKQGWLFNGNEEAIWLTKGKKEVKFDMKVPTNKGLLFAMYFRREAEIVAAATDKPQQMSIKEAHNKLAHSSEDSTRKTAAELGIEITRGLMEPCDACASAKAKQKNVPKESDHKPPKGNDRRIFLDIATVKKVKKGPNVTKPNW
jgi:hypothetical protein